LDIVVDHLNTLNDQTPKINCKGRNGVDPNLIFGVDSKLFIEPSEAYGYQDVTHNDEVETITVYRGPPKNRPHAHEHHHAECLEDAGSEALSNGTDDTDIIDVNDLTKSLESLSKESIWRVKGFVRLAEGVHILNWAFGRFDLTRVEGGQNGTGCVRLTVMGERGEVKRASRKFVAALHADVL
jgi:G3E family GTPase